MKNKMKKFCTFCGKKTIKIDMIKFNPQTGLKEFKMICPDEKCVEGCEDRGGHSWLKEGFWEYMCNREMRCKNCGEKAYGGFY